MSNHEFENYLALVSRLMRLNRSQTATIRDELRDHLETRVSELVESGVDQKDAMRQALEEFGDAAVLANRFQTIFQLNQRRWLMRFTTFSIAGTFLAAILVMAMWPSPARFGSPSTSVAQEEVPIPSNEATEPTPTESKPSIATSIWVDQKLNEGCTLDFYEAPFVEVMDELRDSYQLNVILDQSAKDDSLTADELVTFSIKNVTLSTALRLMLSENNATYVAHDGVLRIISLDSAADPEFFGRQIFDCRELLKKIAATDGRVGQPIQIPVQRGGGGFGGGGAGGGGVFCVAPTQQSPEPPVKPQQIDNKDQQFVVRRITAESLLEDVLKTTINPEGWDSTNGDGTLMTVSGFIVVNQTEHVLDELESLLNELNSRLQ